MIRKYIFGEPFETEAVVEKIQEEKGLPSHGEVSLEKGFTITCHMEENDIVYGLGGEPGDQQAGILLCQLLHR